MSDLKIFGVPQSSYVRTTRFLCHEKSVAYTLQPIQLGSDEHRALHPWAKMPVIDHGGFKLYETSAITRYIDEVFEGPSFVPATAKGRALMNQYINVLDSYVYDTAIRQYAFKYIFAGDDGPDRDAIGEAVPVLERDLQRIDAAYGEREWLAGDALSLADMFVAPVVATVAMFPEGQGVLEKLRNLKRAFNAIEQRDAYKAAQPPPPR